MLRFFHSWMTRLASLLKKPARQTLEEKLEAMKSLPEEQRSHAIEGVIYMEGLHNGRSRDAETNLISTIAQSGIIESFKKSENQSAALRLLNEEVSLLTLVDSTQENLTLSLTSALSRTKLGVSVDFNLKSGVLSVRDLKDGQKINIRDLNKDQRLAIQVAFKVASEKLNNQKPGTITEDMEAGVSEQLGLKACESNTKAEATFRENAIAVFAQKPQI